MFACADVMQLTMYPRKLVGCKLPLEMIKEVLNEEIGELMEYRQVMKNEKYRKLYEKSHPKELGRLAQGIPGQAEGTDTLFFLDKSNVPLEMWRDVTYVKKVINYRPEKDDPYRFRITVGGDRISCPWDCGTPTVDMLAFKIFLNSIVLTPNTKIYYHQH